MSETIFGKYEDVLKSIKLNYKSWLAFFFSVFIINYKSSYIFKIITFLFIFTYAYVIHLFSHNFEYLSVLIIHTHHHNNDTFLSTFLEIIFEFAVFLIYLVMQYLFDIYAVDNFIVLFFSIVYVITHNINYTVFRVNKCHETHHKYLVKNVGPDILDVLFNTKINPEHDIENTDHYIFAICIACVLTLIIENVYNNPVCKYFLVTSFAAYYALSLLLLLIYTLYFIYLEIKLIPKIQEKIDCFIQQNNISNSNADIHSLLMDIKYNIDINKI
jgi:hypothetical protein